MPEHGPMTAPGGVDPMARARSTLLAAAGLPAAWRGAAAWTVLDLDFGQGAAFLATLRAWRDDPARPARLHYAALLAAPVDRDALHWASRSGTEGATADDARRLLAGWPIPVTGVHRIAFASGRVLLTLAVGAPEAMLPGLTPHADTLFLPLRTGAAAGWQPGVVRAACARLTEGGLAAVATLPPDGGTASVATLPPVGATAAMATLVPTEVTAAVARRAPDGSTGAPPSPGISAPRRHADHPEPASFESIARVLAAAGWRVESVADALGGPCARAVRIRGPAAPRPHLAGLQREAMVIGAGLAGSALAYALARRGWTVHRLGDLPGDMPGDMPGIAPDGSGQPALAFHPSVTPDDAPLSRLTRAALLLARTAYDVGAARFTGRLQLDEPAHASAAAAGQPTGWVEAVDAERASRLAGVAVRRGGLWLPMAGSADPRALCEGWTIDGIRSLARRAIACLEAIPGGWRALDARGATLAEAPIAIVATGARDLTLRTHPGAAPSSVWTQLGPAGLRARGARTTLAVAPPGAMPGCVLGGDGHAVPLRDGRLLLGPAETPAAGRGGDEHLSAWQRFVAQLADARSLPPAALEPGPGGTRLSTRDHLPLAGPVPDRSATARERESLRRDDRLSLPVLPGLHVAGAFGGRGLLWSVLVAERIAARLDAEPSPLERELDAALEPGRFLRRALRRGDSID